MIDKKSLDFIFVAPKLKVNKMVRVFCLAFAKRFFTELYFAASIYVCVLVCFILVHSLFCISFWYIFAYRHMVLWKDTTILLCAEQGLIIHNTHVRVRRFNSILQAF